MVDYTTRIRAEKQDTGSNQNTWGSTLNSDALDMIDEAFGVETIALAGSNITLTTANGATDQARHMGLRFTGTGGVTVTIPSVEKVYFVVNDSNGIVTMSAGGTTTAFAAGAYGWVATDGTDTYRDGPTLDKIPAAAGDVAFGSNKLTGVANGTANADAVNLQQLNTAIAAITASSTPGTVRISSQDTTARYLGDAISASTAITATVVDPGGDETLALTLDFASQAEAEAGTASNVLMTPQRTKQAIDALVTGGIVPISTATASNSATIEFTGLGLTYDVYELHIINCIPATDGRRLYMRLSTNGGSSFDSGNNYDTGLAAHNSANASASTGGAGVSAIYLSAPNAGSDTNEMGASLVVKIWKPSASAYTQISIVGTVVDNSGNTVGQVGGATWKSTSDVDAIQILYETGNIESGKFNLYGWSIPT